MRHIWHTAVGLSGTLACARCDTSIFFSLKQFRNFVYLANKRKRRKSRLFLCSRIKCFVKCLNIDSFVFLGIHSTSLIAFRILTKLFWIYNIAICDRSLVKYQTFKFCNSKHSKMADVKHTPKELLDMLKSYHLDSDEEAFGSEENVVCSNESESLLSEDDSTTSEEDSSRESSSQEANILESIHQWSTSLTKAEKLEFTGKCGLQEDLSSSITPVELFEHFFDHDVVMLMVSETNKYAQQFIKEQQLSQHARMQRWKEVTEDEMRKFLGVTLLTGLIKFPRIEDYWKKDPLFFHPILHHIQMPYNRFSLILKNWHFCDNEKSPPGDRLYKISKLMDMLSSNIQKMYSPGEEVSIDEVEITHNGRIVHRKRSSSDRRKRGVRMYKLCDRSGYVWNVSIHCGGKLSKSKIPGLNNSGSIVVHLAESLLDCGRVLAAGSWCSSVELATYLRSISQHGVLWSSTRQS